jgi:hypothetical protein
MGSAACVGQFDLVLIVLFVFLEDAFKASELIGNLCLLRKETRNVWDTYVTKK